MKREVAVRRAIHMLLALAPVYYLLPEDLPYVGLRRWVLLIAFIAGILGFEAFRLWRGFTVLGLRPHETDQIASHAWAATAIVLVLWLFPHDIATAALVGMAFVDPLAGEMRSAKLRMRMIVGVSSIAYLCLAIVALLVWNERLLPEILLLGIVGMLTAIPSEYFKFRHIDDDFLMAVIPAVAMLAASLVV